MGWYRTPVIQGGGDNSTLSFSDLPLLSLQISNQVPVETRPKTLKLNNIGSGEISIGDYYTSASQAPLLDYPYIEAINTNVNYNIFFASITYYRANLLNDVLINIVNFPSDTSTLNFNNYYNANNFNFYLKGKNNNINVRLPMNIYNSNFYYENMNGVISASSILYDCNFTLKSCYTSLSGPGYCRDNTNFYCYNSNIPSPVSFILENANYLYVNNSNLGSNVGVKYITNLTNNKTSIFNPVDTIVLEESNFRLIYTSAVNTSNNNTYTEIYINNINVRNSNFSIDAGSNNLKVFINKIYINDNGGANLSAGSSSFLPGYLHINNLYINNFVSNSTSVVTSAYIYQSAGGIGNLFLTDINIVNEQKLHFRSTDCNYVFLKNVIATNTDFNNSFNGLFIASNLRRPGGPRNIYVYNTVPSLKRLLDLCNEQSFTSVNIYIQKGSQQGLCSKMIFNNSVYGASAINIFCNNYFLVGGSSALEKSISMTQDAPNNRYYNSQYGFAVYYNYSGVF